ncbi:hypothetical protein QJS10_CPB11g00848 [Acorus calamus]|uniref:Uncharacterized protein n=1 Tax=Acorus calamus TaxID=4465 RepID=A0AAV9DWG2_ACOCL|nr:hypothetical protein QJS10_CPB11g00848 [Acorus calamus]
MSNSMFHNHSLNWTAEGETQKMSQNGFQTEMDVEKMLQEEIKMLKQELEMQVNMNRAPELKLMISKLLNGEDEVRKGMDPSHLRDWYQMADKKERDLEKQLKLFKGSTSTTATTMEEEAERPPPPKPE